MDILWGAIAIDLAVQHPEAAELVESSFASIREIVEHQGRFWMFPVDLVLNQRFDSIGRCDRSWCQFYLFTAPVTHWFQHCYESAGSCHRT